METYRSTRISGGAKQWKVNWELVPQRFRELCEKFSKQEGFETPKLGKYLVILKSDKDQVRIFFFFFGKLVVFFSSYIPLYSQIPHRDSLRPSVSVNLFFLKVLFFAFLLFSFPFSTPLCQYYFLFFFFFFFLEMQNYRGV